MMPPSPLPSPQRRFYAMPPPCALLPLDLRRPLRLLLTDVAGPNFTMPHSQSKDGVGDGHNGRPSSYRDKKSKTRSRIFRELVHIAAQQGAEIPLGISTADALQQCLDRAVSLWRFAVQQVDAIPLPEDEALSALPSDLDPTFEVITNPQGPDIVQDHRWYLREREARIEIEKLAAMMTQLGIAERVVRVQEAQAALMIAAIREAAMDIGLTHDQVRALGAALRSRTEGGIQTKGAPARDVSPYREAGRAAVEASQAARHLEVHVDDH